VRSQRLHRQFGSNRTESAVLLSSGAFCVSGRHRMSLLLLCQEKNASFFVALYAVIYMALNSRRVAPYCLPGQTANG
jgi:hypothetical protein